MRKSVTDDGGKLVSDMKILRQVMIAPPIEDYVVAWCTRPKRTVTNGGQRNRRSCSSSASGQARAGAINHSRRKGNASRRPGACELMKMSEKMLSPALRHRIILNFQAEAEKRERRSNSRRWIQAESSANSESRSYLTLF
jgi:hypothetical protein